MSSSAATAPVSDYPPVGTRLDGNSLELVEVLGTGGYGVVYRAVDVTSSNRRSYALKCVAGTYDASARRHLHMREIALHQLASAHPSVITLHRVVRQRNFTFLVMDYAPDGDLFEQILEEGKYLGRDSLIKRVFLQILDAVRHCHSLGIYHRDLKPENVLCFDHGIRVAITDFGLATTEKKSSEYKTGSVYHMSPECQTSDTKNGATYSPLYNDIWSLGILLLNLITGRNPWKSASMDDPTYRAYRRSPRRFLTKILPISDELNSVLVRALAVDWKKRISISDFRQAVTSIHTFYSDQVVFDGNLAISMWECALHLKSKKQKKLLADITASSWPPSRSASQITTIDGLMDEEALGWEYKRHPERASYHSPVHSTYQYSTRTSSSDSASPITPVSDHGDGSQACSFVEWDVYTSNEVEEGNQYPGEDCKQVSIPGPVSAFDDDDDDGSYVSSIFQTPSLNGASTVDQMPQQTHADNFRTVKRHSSPNTSVYAIAEASDGIDPTSMRNVERVDKGETAENLHRAQPIDIPRSKSKTHIFNPMRFFPRSAGKSWLNRKVRF